MNEHHTLTSKCYEQLQNDIIEGTLHPGEKLIIEKLKQRYGVGPTPLREALSRLLDTGLVTILENRGFYVRQVSEADIRDIYHTFSLIETIALTEALVRGDDRWEAGIVSTLHELSLIELKSEVSDYTVWRERNYAFHCALIAGCNSPTLLQIRSTLYKKFDRYCRMSFHLASTHLPFNHEEHVQLSQAALKRDTAEACDLTTHHIFGALEEIIQVLKTKRLI